MPQEGQAVTVTLKRGVKAIIMTWDGGFKVKIVSHLSDETLSDMWVSCDDLVEHLENHEDW